MALCALSIGFIEEVASYRCNCSCCLCTFVNYQWQKL